MCFCILVLFVVRLIADAVCAKAPQDFQCVSSFGWHPLWECSTGKSFLMALRRRFQIAVPTQCTVWDICHRVYRPKYQSSNFGPRNTLDCNRIISCATRTNFPIDFLQTLSRSCACYVGSIKIVYNYTAILRFGQVANGGIVFTLNTLRRPRSFSSLTPPKGPDLGAGGITLPARLLQEIRPPNPLPFHGPGRSKQRKNRRKNSQKTALPCPVFCTEFSLTNDECML